MIAEPSNRDFAPRRLGMDPENSMTWIVHGEYLAKPGLVECR
ncbi:hypothetical protein ACWIGI_39490 [Nocardia sp. NPDC055321]